MSTAPETNVTRYFQGSPERDWPEDFSHENGNYHHICRDCGLGFVGNKRRTPWCRACVKISNDKWALLTPEEQSERFKADQAAIKALIGFPSS